MKKNASNGYLDRLKRHPGLPIAVFLTPTCLLVGLANKNQVYGMSAGLLFSILVWGAVLVSNRK